MWNQETKFFMWKALPPNPWFGTYLDTKWLDAFIDLGVSLGAFYRSCSKQEKAPMRKRLAKKHAWNLLLKISWMQVLAPPPACLQTTKIWPFFAERKSQLKICWPCRNVTILLDIQYSFAVCGKKNLIGFDFVVFFLSNKGLIKANQCQKSKSLCLLLALISSIAVIGILLKVTNPNPNKAKKGQSQNIQYVTMS